MTMQELGYMFAHALLPCMVLAGMHHSLLCLCSNNWHCTDQRQGLILMLSLAVGYKLTEQGVSLQP